MKHKKLLITVLLVAILAISMIALVACNKDDNTNDNSFWEELSIFNYSTYGGGVTIFGLKEQYANKVEIVIPEGVTKIGSYAFDSRGLLVFITIPDSVTEIGKDAFNDTKWLKLQPEGIVYAGKVAYTYKGEPNSDTLELAEGTKGIAEEAFYDCNGIENIEIPNSVCKIGENAFRRCSNLKKITVAENNEFYQSIGNCLIDKSSKKLLAGCSNSIIPSNGEVLSIGTSAFEFCENLEYISIPDCVTTIEDHAFSDCSSLLGVTLGNSLTKIGIYAFAFCRSLLNINLPNSVTIIDNGAFLCCENLTSIVFPKNVEYIGIETFSRCTNVISLSVVTGNKRYRSIDNCIIDTSTNSLIIGCKTSIIPSHGSVTRIGLNAFTAIELTSITIPNSITTIDWQAFMGCTNLSSIYIPSSVTYIQDQTFWACDNLKDIYFSGTKAQWNEVYKGDHWNGYEGTKRIHCTDGDVYETATPLHHSI